MLWKTRAAICVVVLSGAVTDAAAQDVPPGAASTSTRPAASQEDPGEWTYTVRPGDNLWALSHRYLIDSSYWQRLLERHRLADPLSLKPGTRLNIPFAWLKSQPAPAEVLNSAGDVTVVRRYGGATSAATIYTRLLPGDRIRTGVTGSVTVRFADQTRMLIGASSEVVFDALTEFGSAGMVDTRVRLERGRAWSQRPDDGGRRGRYRVLTPTMAAVARGTEFRVEVAADGRTSDAEVLHGAIDARAEAATTDVTAGFGTQVLMGQPPLPPVALLTAPSLDTAPRVLNRLPLRFNVPPVPGAVAYRFEVAADPEFGALVFAGESAVPTLRGADLADGDYVFRVRGVDSHGLEGLDAVSSFTVDARPEAPALIEPAPDATVAAERPRLRWAAPASASAYRVQIASQDGFDRPVVAIDAHALPTLDVPQALTPGKYQWRVATIDARGEVGPFGDPQPFTRRDRPPSPAIEQPAVDANQVVLRWAAGEPGQRYRYQLADNPDFAPTIADATIDSSQVMLTRPAAGTYYLRTMTIDADGYEGSFSPAQTFDVQAEPVKKKRRWPFFAAPAAVGIILLLVL